MQAVDALDFVYLAFVDVAPGIEGVAVHPDGSRVYVADREGVKIINTVSNAVVDEVVVGVSPVAFGEFIGPGISSTSTSTTLAVGTTTTTLFEDCEEARLACESTLSKTEANLTLCREALDTPASDEDADGESDDKDLCPGTGPNAAVDGAGCSVAQFCSAIDATTNKGKNCCKNSDWKNDEPFMKKRYRDCTIDKGAPGPEDDRCIPRVEWARFRRKTSLIPMLPDGQQEGPAGAGTKQRCPCPD